MNTRKFLLVVTISLLFILGACKKEAEEARTEEGTAPEAAPAAAIDPATAATVTGKVVFQGTAPKGKPIRMDAEPSCVKQHAAPVRSQEVVVNDNGTLRYVFVYVKQGLGDRTYPAPKEPAILDQKGCLYIPHVAGLQVGQELHVLNSDPTTHNVHEVPKNNPDRNQSQSPGAGPLMIRFPKAEVMVPVKCNQHPWMRTYLGVLTHPFFSVTNQNGAFTKGSLPLRGRSTTEGDAPPRQTPGVPPATSPARRKGC